ncbi:Protein farnesyltransferase/geranylgeranyltransferase type-1 subunit alpha [Fonsecaea pedrosoi]|nr:Protein farnesyltransferase/geranylgeranyltransferase type-1 subunit alpha [Fonsecaea pedrosoi]
MAETASAATIPRRPKHKSKEPFYAVSPLWKDVVPIPLIDGPPGQKDIGPALATIAYSVRYSEAMSYLRAVMAMNEFSRRTLDLTEDIIAMNPAHYTVWLYRAKILKSLWEKEGVSIEDGVKEELDWLEDVSERNLKNYQIWHHRQYLVSLLPTFPPKEPEFITHILLFDAKNYHVWTYRQWLCRRFPDPLLTTDMELQAVDALINEDVRNNSAWNHRYFVCFGAEELAAIERSESRIRKDVLASGKLVVDEDVVEREINYAKDHIAWAPQNPSPWNYLKGVLKRAGIPITDLQVFCEGFVGGKDADLMSESGNVRSSHAIDWLADIYRLDGKIERSKACLDALGNKWDPIRRKYWDWRAKQLAE